MKKLLTLLLGLGGLALPVVSSAEWQLGCQSGTGFQRNSIGNGGSFVCHDPSAATDAPEILGIASCENVDVFFYDDLDGDGTASAGTHDVYTCPQGNGDDGDGDGSADLNTDAERRLGCQPLNGGTTLSSTNTEVFGMSGAWMWVDSAGATNDGRIIVRCAQPSGR